MKRTAVQGGIAATLVAVLLYNQHNGIQARQRGTCEAVNEVKTTLSTYIDQQLNRSVRSLPTIDYYRRHPVELGRQLAALERQRQQTHDAFKTSEC